MAKKDSTVKFTEDEMNKLTELQQTYGGVQNAMGQVGVQRIRLEQQMTDLETAEGNLKSQFTETQTKERDFVQEINKKYDNELTISLEKIWYSLFR